MVSLGEEIFNRLEVIAEISEPGPGVTRQPFTSEHQCSLKILQNWMEQAGLEVHLDDAGTLIGRREGTDTTKTLLLGSHQDSVPQGGKYDGILGVVLPIVCLEKLKNEPLPFSVEVLAFADEEGVRFPTALIGPRALAGTFDPSVLQMTDRKGISIEQALEGFSCKSNQITHLKRNPVEIMGYMETHIEQGPVLEDKGVAVGIVTAICGIERWTIVLDGRAAHAGTTPMNLRRDALAGAAEVILEVEKYCLDTDGLVGVVGELNVTPNAVNAIPGSVKFQIEFRSDEDEKRTCAGCKIEKIIKTIARRRNIRVRVEQTYSQKAAPCDPVLSKALNRAASSIGINAPKIMSGATHDASAMADLTPMAMLFVRCKNGISHNPRESVTAEDIDSAAAVVKAFLLQFQIH